MYESIHYMVVQYQARVLKAPEQSQRLAGLICINNGASLLPRPLRALFEIATVKPCSVRFAIADYGVTDRNKT